MTQSGSGRGWKPGLICSLAIGGVIASSGDCTLAQSKITPDDTLVEAERSIVTPNITINGLPSDQINGGAKRGANLFHSFREFNVDEGQRVYFFNPAGVENILSRVTGGNSSNILGRLGVTGGNANLFLISPKGIIFGAKASLDVGGSFVATTANAIQFGNQGFFSASAPNELGLLTVNPSALLFNQIAAGAISSNSREPAGQRLDPSDPSGFRHLFGLRVLDGRSLLLVGGNVNLDSGGLNALGGRVELAGVAGTGTVELDISGNNLSLSFLNGIALADVSLVNRAIVDTSSDKGGGDIQVQGGQVMFTVGSRILTTALGSQPGGNLTVNASESIKLMVSSGLFTTTEGAGAAGDLTIKTRKLIVQDGSQVLTSTSGKGLGGQLTVNALESVELSGISQFGTPSNLFSSTAANGNAGDLTINTRRLLIQNGARVSTESSGVIDDLGNFIPAIGQGGKLKVKASEFVELSGSGKGANGSPSSSALLARTQGDGAAGDINITTGRLTIQDGAEVTVSSTGGGAAGNLKIIADSIRLENQGSLRAETKTSEGNITIQANDILLRKSNITTDAAEAASGGNIKINTIALSVLENSNITADAEQGRGGNIQITTQGLFLSPDSNIRASSERGIDGEVEINTLDDFSSGVVTLPTELVDVSALIAQGCSAGGGNVARGASKFVATGRGGLPPTPTEALRSDSALADLGTPVQGDRDRPSANISTNQTNFKPVPLVEAQGWVIGPQGEVVLIAQAPTITPHTPWLTPTTCNGS